MLKVKVYLYGHLAYSIIVNTESDAWDLTTKIREQYDNMVDFIIEEVQYG